MTDVTSTTTDYAADLDLAIRAARAAGDAIMPAFRATPEVRFKGADQPVTDADLEADRILHRMLLGERPDYGWLSEETADSPERLGKARLWVVDPIDGTNSFVKGIPDWVVCVGLVEGGRAVVGVVYNPTRGEMYHASAGGGAFLDGRPIHVADAGGEAPVLFASRSELRRGDFAAFAEAGWRVEPLGSTAYRMVKVAEGAGHASFSRGGKNEWDVCAADVILAEAGGRTTDLSGAEYRYNRAETRRRGIVVTNGRLHDDVLARIHAEG
jgi:myo-inositol-1(or 4)-monophosphatase